MTHLTMDQLLALRTPGSEPGTAEAQAHLQSCAECARELDRLHQRVARLRALPTLRPPRDGFAVMAESATLEQALRQLRSEERVTDAYTTRAVASLEDRIADLDRQLGQAQLRGGTAEQTALLTLWRERVGLLDALVDVHVTRAHNVGL
jgi:hypothetical protein